MLNTQTVEYGSKGVDNRKKSKKMQNPSHT